MIKTLDKEAACNRSEQKGLQDTNIYIFENNYFYDDEIMMYDDEIMMNDNEMMK